MRRLPTGLSALIIGSAFLWLFVQERRRALRRSTEPGLRRPGRNAAMALASGLALHVTEAPVTRLATAWVERRRWGLLRLRLPIWLEIVSAVVLLDYTLYVWHVLTHRVPWLWRYHIVHHVDLDLDVTTAVRFHWAEMVASVPWRAGQIVLIGVSPLALSIWQTLLLVSVMFHHSNVRLSLETERRLNRFIVTPRMHGIHHSVIEGETNSNWSSGLTIWDRLHGTLKLDVPQESIEIGVPAYRDPTEIQLVSLLLMPFRAQRPSWVFHDTNREGIESRSRREPYALTEVAYGDTTTK
jgi:sterol desaturase/sphingolipid hydroxylase (fatty acid hydroxylase superfamily)